MNLKEEFEEMKYQHEKAARVRDSLQKNLDRRKKLNLVDSIGEEQLKDEIAEAGRQADDFKRKMRSLESQMARSKVISESDEKTPWDN